jgi:hypothetical protein
MSDLCSYLQMIPLVTVLEMVGKTIEGYPIYVLKTVKDLKGNPVSAQGEACCPLCGRTLSEVSTTYTWPAEEITPAQC